MSDPIPPDRPSVPSSPFLPHPRGHPEGILPGAPGAVLERPTPPPEDLASGPDPERTLPPLRFTFDGTGREYFGIWIVNVLLTIVTLGVYTAWAKVRRKSYFYGNTGFAGGSFQYLGNPFVILRGWLLAAGLFLAYTFGSRIHPAVGPALGVLFAAVMPWLVVRSRMFNARNSSYRNIRFGFRPNYGEAYAVILGYGILVPLTLGILLPYADYRRRKFVVESSSYGKTPFRFAGNHRAFYAAYLKGVGLFLALFFGTALVAFPLAFGALRKIGPAGGIGTGIRLAVAGMIYGCFFVSWIFVRTRLTNLTLGAASLGPVSFQSSLRARDMVWLYLSNAAAIACTLGLLVPWARVRLARYRCNRLAAELAAGAGEGLDGFLAAAEPDVGAAGEEIGDLLDIDISL
jgi:uncharacterized membrane protein YjgN (DUF898 family)